MKVRTIIGLIGTAIMFSVGVFLLFSGLMSMGNGSDTFLIVGIIVMGMSFVPLVAAHLPDILNWMVGDVSSNSAKRRCMKCGRVIPEDARLCPYCGNDFS